MVVLWHGLGWCLPALQAYWANHHIRALRGRSIDESGQFDPTFVSSWEARLKDEILGRIADQIYEHEAGRRTSIVTKAQASLTSMALIFAAVSLSIVIAGRQWKLLELVPGWIVLLGVLYFLMAFLLAFWAVHVHRYFAVEYDELKKLLEGPGGDDPLAVGSGIRARRLAAVFQNRRQTLLISNLTEASFMSLRNGILVLLLMCAYVYTSYAPDESAVTRDEVSRESGEDRGGERRSQDLPTVARSRYLQVWPRD